MTLHTSARSALQEARAILASIPIFAQALCGEKSVQVVFSNTAQTACTDGKKITLPGLPVPTHPTQLDVCRQLADLVGVFIPHEVGHIRYSSFRVIKDLRTQLERSLLNAIEDPRMELEMIRDLPGTRQQMDVGLDRLADMGWFPPLTVNDDPSELVSMYVLYYLRGGIREQARMHEAAVASRPALVEVFGNKFVERLEAIMEVDGSTMRSTKDAAEMGRRILKALQQAEQEKEEEQQQSGQSNEKSDGQSGDQGNSAGDGQSDGDEADAPAGGGKKGGKAGGKKAGAADSKADGGHGGQNPGDQSSDAGSDAGGGAGSGAGSSNPFTQAINGDKGARDLGEILSDALQATQDDARSQGLTPVIHDVVNSVEAEQKRVKADSLDAFDPMEAAMATRALKTKLRSHLQTATLQRTHDSVRGNRISPRKVHRTGQYDRRLFVHQDDRKGIETVVYLLGDTSGSMQGARITTLARSLYAVAESMGSVPGVKVGLGLFPGNEIVLPIGASPRAAVPRLGLSASGGTPMSTAMTWAGRQLAARKEPRKLLLVLTDGEPENRQAVVGVMAGLEHMGIEVYGVGIQHLGVKQLFDRHCVVEDLHTLPTAILGMLKETMLKPFTRAA